MAPKGRKRKSEPAEPLELEPLSDQELARMLKFLIDDAPAEFSTIHVTKTNRGKEIPQPCLFDLMQVNGDYTPLQILVSALVMSKPISSRLGVRTLLTLFNEEYDLTNAVRLTSYTQNEMHEILDHARTQHKDKTANQLGLLGDLIIEKYLTDPANEEDTSLEKIRQAANGSEASLDSILKEFKGIADVGCQIFKRRIQANWTEFYPFADERSLKAASQLTLRSSSTQELADEIKRLLPTSNPEQEAKQFAKVVDALIAADLEGKIEDVYSKVGKIEKAKQDQSSKKARSEK